VEALDYGFAVSILEHAYNGPRQQIDLFLVWRCHLTIYQPLGGAKRIGSQCVHDGLGEQSTFFGPSLDNGPRL